jgi:hypothetical protein
MNTRMKLSPIIGALAAGLALSAPVAAHESPAPAASRPTTHPHVRTTAKPPSFSAKVRNPTGNARIGADACNRRSIGLNSARGQLGPGNSSKSQTLVAIPIGGGSASSATRQARVDEACGHTH